MDIFKLINKKVIAVFACSMFTIITTSIVLANIDKDKLKSSLASVNLIDVQEKPKEQAKVIDLTDELTKEQNLTIRVITYAEMTLEEKTAALYNGELKLEYSAYYTYDSSRLTSSKGAQYFNGHKETYYSQNVLPGASLNIPGRHVADDGTVRDGDGYICVAANPSFMSKGDILITSLGPAKVYDTGCAHGVIDIYVNW